MARKEVELVMKGKDEGASALTIAMTREIAKMEAAGVRAQARMKLGLTDEMAEGQKAAAAKALEAQQSADEAAQRRAMAAYEAAQGRKFEVSTRLDGMLASAQEAREKEAAARARAAVENRAQFQLEKGKVLFNGLEMAELASATRVDKAKDSLVAKDAARLMAGVKFGLWAAAASRTAQAVSVLVKEIGQVARGAKSVSEGFDGVARAIPVFGEVYTAVRDIRAELSGWAAEDEKIIKGLEKMTVRTREWYGVFGGIHTEIVKIGEEMTKARRQSDDWRGNSREREIGAKSDVYSERVKKLREEWQEAGKLGNAGILEKARIEKLIIEAEKTFNKEKAEINARYDRQALDETTNLQRDIARAQSEGRERQLREMGQTLAADQEAKRRAGQMELDELEDRKKQMREGGVLGPLNDALVDSLSQTARQNTKDDIDRLYEEFDSERRSKDEEEFAGWRSGQSGAGRGGGAGGAGGGGRSFELLNSRFQGVSRGEQLAQETVTLLGELVKLQRNRRVMRAG